MRLAALFAAVVALVAATVTPAHSDPLPDGTKLGSITVALEQLDHRTMAGVTFQATPVDGLDVSTNSGQLRAQDVSDSFYDLGRQAFTDAGLTFGTPRTAITGTSGIAFMGDLPVGLWLVEDVKRPDYIRQFTPFVVAIPMTDTDSLDGWTYDVEVFPKPQVEPIQSEDSNADFPCWTRPDDPDCKKPVKTNPGITGVELAPMFAIAGGLVLLGGSLFAVLSRRRDEDEED